MLENNNRLINGGNSLIPAIKKEEFSFSIFLPVNKVSLKSVAGGVSHSAETMRLVILIQWS